MPVGAGTPRLQRASLRLWEAFEAARARRTRTVLYHSALKLHTEGRTRTLELMPAFIDSASPPLLTGPVGAGLAGPPRPLPHQRVCTHRGGAPPRRWGGERAQGLAHDESVARAIIALAPAVPPYTWGRRVRGTSEMWTSDSVISWLLLRAGVDLAAMHIPAGGRAPGWEAGLEVASRGLHSGGSK